MKPPCPFLVGDRIQSAEFLSVYKRGTVTRVFPDGSFCYWLDLRQVSSLLWYQSGTCLPAGHHLFVPLPAHQEVQLI